MKYAKQTGGRGQYGHAKIHLYPGEPGSGYIFENEIVGAAIPKEFIKPVDEGIKEALTRGVLAGYPIDDVRIELYDGSFHDVDSSEMAFKIAGSMAFQDAAKKAKPVLLEPIMRVEVVVPKDYMGDVMGDLASRRGRARAAVGDVRLRDRPAVAHAGPRHLLDAFRSLRAGAAERLGRSGGADSGHQVESRFQVSGFKRGLRIRLIPRSGEANGQRKIRSFETTRQRRDHRAHRPWQDDADGGADEGSGRQGVGEVRPV
jgi:hypothetical protein